MVDAGVYFGGVLATNVISWEYNTSISAITNKCRIVLENGGGINVSAANHFNDIKIYPSADVLVWRGEVYDIMPHKDGTLEIIGFGYMRGLMNRFHTGTFTTTARSAIVESLVDTYGGGITTITHITASGDSITRIIKGVSVFDAILELADDIGFDVWVGDDLEFYFVERGTVSSGRTITKTGGLVASAEAPTEGRIIYNRVFVYGDANKDGVCETKVLVEDRSSQLTYGVIKEYPQIIDPSLQSEPECQARGQQIMDTYSTPVKILNTEVFGYNDVTPGETVIISGFGTVEGMPDGTYIVLERSGTSMRGSQVLILAQYTSGTSDTIADLIRRMRKREYSEIDSTAAATQFLRFYETVEIEGYVLTVKRTQIGQSFITGHPVNGIGGLTANNIVTGMSGRTITTDISESVT